MRIATLIIRILFGLMFLFASGSYFYMTFTGKMPPMDDAPEGMKTFMAGVMATGYLMPLVKIVELLCGLALVVGRFVPLANIAILPITINIFLLHAFLEPDEALMGAVLLLANIFLIYAYRSHYTRVFEAK